MDKKEIMGIFPSRFSLPFFRVKSPDMYKKQLEKINKEILGIEQKKIKLEYQYKTIVQFIVAYSRLLYVLVACVFFFSSLPSSFMEYVMFCGPLIIFHIMICFLKGGLKWYFGQEIRQKCEQIRKLKFEKNSILSQVKETTKFKDAKEIIEEFSQEMPVKRESTANLDRALFPGRNHTRANEESPLKGVVDYVFGEERNALICKFCKWHNGMALEEEYEYVGFRCCHCFGFNRPRKHKPPSSEA